MILSLPSDPPAALADGVLARDRRALAKAITLVESTLPEHRREAQALLEALLPRIGESLRVGISGAPGVGKSTFIESLGLYLLEQGRRVAVLAVDPSSSLSGGSILGDKTRMERLSTAPNAFIRPTPTSGSLGGVAARTREAISVCEAAGHDVILVETVGVGQSETDVADCTDTVLFCVQPGSGDSLQFMKAGIVEIPDIVAVTKADLGTAAERARSDVAGALSLAPDVRSSDGDWRVPVLAISAQTGEGLDRLDSALDHHAGWLAQAGRLAARRLSQAETWTRAFVRNQFGREGLNRLGDFEYHRNTSPFRRAALLAGGADGDDHDQNGK